MSDSEHGWQAAPRVPLYALTGGRTTPDVTLRLESQFRTRTGSPPAGLEPEQGRLAELCRSADRSVAELAGTLNLPTPVVMVLVSDLLKGRVLRMVIPQPSDADHHPALINAFLTGLQAKWGVTSGAGC